MIVEFIGESGCGKSTLAREIIPLVDNNAKTKGSLVTLDNILAIFHLFMNPKTRILFLKVIRLNFRINKFSRFVKNALYIAGLTQIFLHEKKDDIWIIDQGIIQFLFSVFFCSVPNGDEYVEIIRGIMDYDYYIVFCYCDYTTLVQRINKRRLNNERRRRIEEASENLIDLHNKTANKFLGNIPEERQISINTGGELKKNAEDVSQFINSRRNDICEPKRPY